MNNFGKRDLIHWIVASISCCVTLACGSGLSYKSRSIQPQIKPQITPTLTGAYSIQAISCGTSQHGPYGAPSSGGMVITHSLHFDPADGKFIQDDSSTGVTCKYYEKIGFRFLASKIVDIQGSNQLSADPANHPTCGPAPTASLVDQYLLSGQYQVNNSGHGLILTSRTDDYCRHFGHPGVNVVLTLSKL